MSVNIITKKLPNEYQEVEYVQSSGTQYIDTGIKLSSADTIKCKFEITSKPSDYNYRDGVYGTMEQQNGTNVFFVLLMRDPNQARVGTSSNQVSSTNLALNTVYDTTLSNGTYIENGTTYTFTPHSGFTFTTNCWFFRRNQTVMLATSAKFYSFEIVGKFKGVPCYRKSDNVIGFYDLVSNTFFTNAGTGDFTKGSDVNEYNIQKVNSNIVVYDTPRIPNEYQEVEYIESDGTGQYIDLGLKPTSNTKVELDVCAIRTSSNALFGSRNGTQQNNYSTRMVLFLRDENGYQRISPQFSTNSAVNYTTSFTGFVNIKFSKDGCYVNDTTIETYATQTISGTTYNLYLFTFNEAGTPDSRYFMGKLKTFKLWDNNILLRNFIPCYRKSDNEVGMYDLVNGVFYTNQGTGTFTKGSLIDLPSEYQKLEYIESTGTQYIDTMVYLNANSKISVNATPTQISTDNYLFGTSDGSTWAMCIFRNAIYAQFGESRKNKSLSSPSQDVNYSVIIDANLFTVNNVNYTNEGSPQTLQSTLYIFARNTNGLVSGSNGYFKLYYCKIYDNDILVRDFTPCYRKTDGIIGLYDTVNGVFYTNAGTGTFLKSGDVLPIKKVKTYILNRILPSEYKRVSYIESTGTQYINSGIIGNERTNAEAKFVLTELTQNNNILSAYGSSSNTRNYLISSSGTNYLRLGYGSELQASSILAEVNTVYTFKTNITSSSQEIIVNNVSALSINTTQTFSSSSLAIFANNQNGTIQNYSKARLYYLKIYDNKTLVRNFIPCYRKSDSEIGLYDTVNNIFYTNQGTGKFIAGNEYRNLPDEYQQVEYLGVASDNPYIDTGVTGNQNTKAEVIFSSSGDTQVCLFGYQANAVGITFNLSVSTNNTRFGAWAKVGWGSDMFDGNKHTVEISQQGLYQDGTLVDTPTTQTFTTGNLTLFKADGAMTYGNKTIYGCKIWNNGVLQRDLVPCYRKSDNVKGMYDKVSNQFLTNIGTGSFTKGNDIQRIFVYDIIKI